MRWSAAFCLAQSKAPPLTWLNLWTSTSESHRLLDAKHNEKEDEAERVLFTDIILVRTDPLITQWLQDHVGGWRIVSVGYFLHRLKKKDDNEHQKPEVSNELLERYTLMQPRRACQFGNCCASLEPFEYAKHLEEHFTNPIARIQHCFPE